MKLDLKLVKDAPKFKRAKTDDDLIIVEESSIYLNKFKLISRKYL